MTYTWQRYTFKLTSLTNLTFRIAAIPAGQTYTRIRFGWSAWAGTNSYSDLTDMLGPPIVFGWVTTIGDGLEYVPDPIFDPIDVDPPAQRWLWWEGRSMHVDGYAPADGGASFVTTEEPQEPCDARAQVRAPVMPAGSTLNLWASVQSDFLWPSSIDWELYAWASVLVKS